MNNSLTPLIERAQAGDESAMVELFGLHRDRLQRMIHLRIDRRIQGRVDVSDVLQEAYVDLAKQLPNYSKDPKLPFFLWMRRITGQRLAKLHRFYLGQQKRDVRRQRSLAEDGMPNASACYAASQLIGQFTSVAGKAIREETRVKVREVLESLGDSDREVILLRHIEQLSNEETAIELGISAKAASMRYARALLRLKSEFERIPGMLDDAARPNR